MAIKVTKESLQMELDHFKNECPELEGIILYPSDARLGKNVALARMGDKGAVNTLTAFMPYIEMYRFLWGYYSKAINKLK